MIYLCKKFLNTRQWSVVILFYFLPFHSYEASYHLPIHCLTLRGCPNFCWSYHFAFCLFERRAWQHSDNDQHPTRLFDFFFLRLPRRGISSLGEATALGAIFVRHWGVLCYFCYKQPLRILYYGADICASNK